MKKILRNIILAIIITALAIGLTACNKGDDQVKIAAILMSSSSEITTSQGNAIVAYAEAKGAKCSLDYHDQSVAKEASLIENAVSAGADIIIVQSESANDCVAEITKATEAGAIVILYGTDVPEADYTYIFTEDSYALGRQLGTMAANWANENLVANGTPVVAALGNYSVTSVAVDRNRGIQEALLELCPETEIVGTYEMAYKEEGLPIGENILQSNPDVNLVVGINDQSVCGVYEAFVAAGKGEETIGMFGIDGAAEALWLISQDTLYKGSISISADKVGELMVQAGLDKLSGSENAPKDKYVYWSAEEITSENIEDFKDVWGSFAG